MYIYFSQFILQQTYLAALALSMVVLGYFTVEAGNMMTYEKIVQV